MDFALRIERLKLAKQVALKHTIEREQKNLNISLQVGNHSEVQRCLELIQASVLKERMEYLQNLRSSLGASWRRLKDLGFIQTQRQQQLIFLRNLNAAIPFSSIIYEVYESECMELQDRLEVLLLKRSCSSLEDSVQGAERSIEALSRLSKDERQTIEQLLAPEVDLLQEKQTEYGNLKEYWMLKYQKRFPPL